jgi:hypothetical protein
LKVIFAVSALPILSAFPLSAVFVVCAICAVFQFVANAQKQMPALVRVLSSQSVDSSVTSLY